MSLDNRTEEKLNESTVNRTDPYIDSNERMRTIFNDDILDIVCLKISLDDLIEELIREIDSFSYDDISDISSHVEKTSSKITRSTHEGAIQILSCGADKTVILWDVMTGSALRRLRGHASHVTCVRFNEESSFALSGSRDNTVMGWDIRSRSQDPVQVLREAKDSITSLQVSDYEILVGSLDCWLRRFDIRTGQFYSDFVGEPIMSSCFTHDGQCTVVSTTDSVVRLFDKDTGELLSEYSGHATGDYAVECGVDQSDRHVLSGAVDGSMWCWELVQGTVVSKLVHSPAKAVTSLSVHPTQPKLLSAAANTFNLWALHTSDGES